MKKLGLGLLLVPAFVFTLLILPLLVSVGSVQAASTYEYEVIDPDDNPTDCPPGRFDPDGTGEVMTVREIEEQPEGNYIHYWCYVPESGFLFQRSTANGLNITVDGNKPSEGVLGNIGAASGDRIAIGNASVFTDFFPDAAEDTNPAIEEGNANPNLQPLPDSELAEGEEEVRATCENIGSIAWIVCPVIKATDEALNWLDSQIQDLLEIDRNKYSENEGLKRAWANIRNIAYIILIPIMLVMVIGTALGFEVFSAYTVKKALPRMVIAVIFITFSWYITSFLIDLFNVIGAGVLGLMTSPFTIGGEGIGRLGLADLFAVDGAGSFWQTILAQGALTLGIVVVIWLFLGPLALILLTAFMILLLRQMFITALVLVAPLAILAWIFPGNDKLWKTWWGAFSKLLMMFPIIMAVIASGRIFAAILKTADDGGVDDLFLTPLLILAAYILPYAVIPFTFKLAGGLFATLTGMVNDREKGFFDKSRQKRAEKFSRAQNNNLFNPNSRLGKLNNAAGWMTSPLGNAAYRGRNIPGLRSKGQKIKSAIEGDVSDQSGKLFQELNEKYKFNDRAYRAISGAHDGFSAPIRQKLNAKNLLNKAPGTVQEYMDMADILATSDKDSDRIAANLLRGAAGRLTTLNTDPEMGRASAQAAGIMGLSAHGFADGKDLSAVGNNMIDKGASPELAQSIINGAQVLGQRQRPDIKAGYGTTFKDGNFIDGMSPEGGRARDLIKTLSSADLASAKSGSLKTLTPVINEMLAGPSAELRTKVESGAATEDEIKSFNTQTGEQQAVKDQLFNWAGPYSQASVDVKRQALDIINSDPTTQSEFAERRRRDTDPTLRGETGGREEDEGGH